MFLALVRSRLFLVYLQQYVKCVLFPSICMAILSELLEHFRLPEAKRAFRNKVAGQYRHPVPQSDQLEKCNATEQ